LVLVGWSRDVEKVQITKKRAAVAAGSAVVLVAVALGGYVLTSDKPETGSPSATPGTSAPPRPDGAVSMDGRAPLTGVPIDQPLNRPAVTVKVSNTPDAHPQRGLADADLVFVEPITGATTRLAAVFHSKLPDQVGPVRSLRPTDAPLLGPTKGIVADTMADKWVRAYFDKVTDVDDLGSLSVPRGTYRLDPHRRAPNHVFAQPAKLLALTKRTAPPTPYFNYAAGVDKSTAWRSGAPATAVKIGYGGSATATWTYRSPTHRWTRAEQWSPHVVEGGGQVAADNVLVLRAAPDHSFARAKPSMTILDLTDTSGSLQLFTGGKVVSGRWSKADVNAPFSFTGPDGKALLLTPGTTWVECALTSMPVQVSGGSAPR
jgi:hypothetical protein